MTPKIEEAIVHSVTMRGTHGRGEKVSVTMIVVDIQKKEETRYGSKSSAKGWTKERADEEEPLIPQGAAGNGTRNSRATRTEEYQQIDFLGSFRL